MEAFSKLWSVLQEHIDDRKKSLLLAIYTCAVFSIPFAVFCFMCANTANIGFDIVLTAILNLFYVGGAYYIIQYSSSPLAVGFLIGVSFMISILNLMTAVYWGELSNCEILKDTIAQYTCTTPAAYGAVSAFATLLLATQTFLTAAIAIWRSSLLDQQQPSMSHPLTSPAQAHGQGQSQGSYDSLPSV